MSLRIELKTASRQRRKRHIHKIVHGVPDRPRLVVYRSLKYIYAQLVDDRSGKVLGGLSSRHPTLRQELVGMKGKVSASHRVGQALAALAKAKGIEKVVFDRNGYLYHGRVKAVAEGAREGGLIF